MVWSCTVCTVCNENDTFLTCSLCGAVRDISNASPPTPQPSPKKTASENSPPKKQSRMSVNGWGLQSMNSSSSSSRNNDNSSNTNNNYSNNNSNNTPPPPPRPPPITALKTKRFTSIFETCMLNKSLFEDDEFKAALTSLDGTTNTTPPPNCYCSLPALSKTIRKAGSTQGRPYFTCGRKFSFLPPKMLTPQEKADNDLKCKYFAFTSLAKAITYEPYKKISWHRLPDGVLFDPKRDPSPLDVKQGGLGNCWFQSALSCIASQPNLVYQLFSTARTNKVGCYEISLYTSGTKVASIIDDRLPMKNATRNDKTKLRPTAIGAKKSGRGGVVVGEDLYIPAFSAAPNSVLWPALVEKTYAKAYGNYKALTGGWVCEALHDLTGAPYEIIHLRENELRKDELWVRLLSYNSANFIFGLGCFTGEKERGGLVSGHAYSLLDVKVIHNVTIGKQQTMTNFFSGEVVKKRKVIEIDDCDDGGDGGDGKGKEVEESYTTTTTAKQEASETRDVRLLLVRNPWGQTPWSGDWGAMSEKWTKKTRKLIGNTTFNNKLAEGASWIEFEDFIKFFYTVDILKNRRDYIRSEYSVLMNNYNDHKYDQKTQPHFNFASRVIKVMFAKNANIDIMLIQESKRAHPGDSFWYQDASVLVVRRVGGGGGGENFVPVTVLLGGEQRVNQTKEQLFVEGGDDVYYFIPFSLKGEKSNGVNVVIYAPEGIVTDVAGDDGVSDALNDFTPLLYKTLLAQHQTTADVCYSVVKTHSLGKDAILLRIRLDGVIIWLVANNRDESIWVDFALLGGAQMFEFAMLPDTPKVSVPALIGLSVHGGKRMQNRKHLVGRHEMKLVCWATMTQDKFSAFYKFNAAIASDGARDGNNAYLGSGKIEIGADDSVIEHCSKFGVGECELDGNGDVLGYHGGGEML